MFRIVSSLLLSGLIAFFFSSCDFFEDPIQKRAEYALSKKRDIKIGIVDTSLVPSYFVKGARLAIDEFNHSRQIKQKLVPIIADDEGLIEKGQQIAKELVKDPSLIAVVGHQLSSVAISSAITYETNNVLFLSHGATQADLIRDEHRFIFRNIPCGYYCFNLLNIFNNKNRLIF